MNQDDFVNGIHDSTTDKEDLEMKPWLTEDSEDEAGESYLFDPFQDDVSFASYRPGGNQ